VTLLPIVGRELRVAARRPGTYWIRFGSGLVLLLVFALLLFSSSRSQSPARLGHEIFIALGVFMLGFCMLLGLFLTADLISQEKREGTLGLLFLTPLKTYDVILGKLASSSLQALFALLSVFPVLALPLMMGGVNGSEFLRVVLVLTVTAFCSLALGLMASSASIEARQGLTRTLFLILLVSAAGPLLWLILAALGLRGIMDSLLWPSPVYAFVRALDGGSGAARLKFLDSTCTLGIITILAWIAATWKVHQSARSDPLEVMPKRMSRAGSRKLAAVANPFRWLTECRCHPRRVWNRLLLISVPVWGLFLYHASTFPRSPAAFPVAFLTCISLIYGLHQVLKILMTIEASRRFSEDRQNGALELLLVSPITERQLLEGQATALWRRFLWPMASLAVLNVILLLAVAFHFSKMFGGDSKDRTTFCLMLIGALFLLLADFRALLWVGMWRALAAPRHHRAVMGTLAIVMLFPWFLVFLVFAGLGDALNLSFRGACAAWFTICFSLDLLVTVYAKRLIKRQFRHFACS